MALTGHVLKEISRKVRTCIVEDGLSEEECVERIEEEYELDDDDRSEVKEMAKEIGR